jgi:hypothetical protein
MSENTVPSPTTGTHEPNSPNDLARTVARLRAQLQAALVLMIMVTGALNLYLLRQYVALRKDVQLLKPQVGQMMTLYDKATRPLAEAFLSQLAEFARQHPDFQPILDRYRVQVTPATGASPAGGTTPAAPAQHGQGSTQPQR